MLTKRDDTLLVVTYSRSSFQYLLEFITLKIEFQFCGCRGNFNCYCMKILFFSQLCDEIDQNEKNSQDVIEEEKKRIPGNNILWRTLIIKFYVLPQVITKKYLIITRLFNA